MPVFLLDVAVAFDVVALIGAPDRVGSGVLQVTSDDVCNSDPSDGFLTGFRMACGAHRKITNLREPYL